MSPLRIAQFALAGLTAAVAGVWLASMLIGPRPAAVVNNMQFVTAIPTPRGLPAFELVDQDAQRFSVEELHGRWTLLFMGFTNCGHVCPMTMAKLRTIVDTIDQPVDVLFVSVDPGRDTPEAIANYVHGFDASFRGATGTPAEIDKLANALGAPYFVDATGEKYIVDHSSAIFVVNPDAALAATITSLQDVEPVASELEALLEKG